MPLIIIEIGLYPLLVESFHLFSPVFVFVFFNFRNMEAAGEAKITLVWFWEVRPAVWQQETFQKSVQFNF